MTIGRFTPNSDQKRPALSELLIASDTRDYRKSILRPKLVAFLSA